MKGLIALSLVSFFSVSAFAKPPYLAKLKATYPSEAAAKCTFCHNGTGYKDRNDFAKDFAANNYDFKAIEGFDSDVDGFTNIAEITAGTLPGDKDSHPATVTPVVVDPTPVVADPTPAPVVTEPVATEPTPAPVVTEPATVG